MRISTPTRLTLALKAATDSPMQKTPRVTLAGPAVAAVAFGPITEQQDLRQRKVRLTSELAAMAQISPRALNSYAKHRHGNGVGVEQMTLEQLRAIVDEFAAWRDEMMRIREAALRPVALQLLAVVDGFASDDSRDRVTPLRQQQTAVVVYR